MSAVSENHDARRAQRIRAGDAASVRVPLGLLGRLLDAVGSHGQDAAAEVLGERTVGALVAHEGR